MTTVVDLIEYLNTLPADTEVSVLSEVTAHYQVYTEEAPLLIGENTEFINLSGNPNISMDDPRYNKKYLFLGNK